ncbi:plasmid pRiA4b ORF-3 family protein [Sporosarcina sp. PTS2304]|uniref:plasmid pRiA4b ORF-3 family protein n=1 Tax=Sporosarcina sp. PTS2304 TaxID=2283194 RepID=UPI000E0DB614|nr:plasmid pRiA4b ORF-3 family protein [Sporosarcina sp. PTS2304]AXI00255.1 plasmid pRiA4b ORF-3 family protein [Sporosarcina sp. PTS2304]
MQIHVTKKVLDAIPFAPEEIPEVEGNPMYAWHANLITFNRRKTLVLMNDSTRYVVVLHGLKAKEIKQLDVWVVEAIRQTLKAERAQEEVIEQYIREAGGVTFHKTKNRSMVTRLNQACDVAACFYNELDPAELISTTIGKRASRFLVGGGKLPATYPHEEMMKELAELAGVDSIFSERAARMHISMVLEKQLIWRRVLVPLNISFTDFHQMMQVLFNWHDSHLHEFLLYDESVSSDTSQIPKPIVSIVSYEEAFDYAGDMELKREKGLLLSDFVPRHQYIKYVYDFGDNWEHDIVLEEIVDDAFIESPVCLEGEGTAPPEDCGGEHGFDEFLLVMNDPAHPDHQSMKEWVSGQLHREFDRIAVNHELKMI